MKQKKGWDGTPPERTYPCAIRTSDAIHGEPGTLVYPAKGEVISSSWSWSRNERKIEIKKLVQEGTWHHVTNPTGTPSEYEVIDTIDLTDVFTDVVDRRALYQWVRLRLDRYVQQKYGVVEFTP